MYRPCYRFVVAAFAIYLPNCLDFLHFSTKIHDNFHWNLLLLLFLMTFRHFICMGFHLFQTHIHTKNGWSFIRYLTKKKTAYSLQIECDCLYILWVVDCLTDLLSVISKFRVFSLSLLVLNVPIRIGHSLHLHTMFNVPFPISLFPSFWYDSSNFTQFVFRAAYK